MLSKYILPAAALAGVLFAIYFVRAGNKPLPPGQPIAQPAQAPFNAYIAGAGIVEASTENISVGTQVAGIVTEVLVKVGDQVTRGQPLFRIDDRDLQAELLIRNAAVHSAEARRKVEEAALADSRNQLEMWASVSDSRAVSKEELDRRKFAVETQEARLGQANAELEAAKAGVQATLTLIDRTIVKAPVDGEVLQVRVRPGEFAASAAPGTSPLMLIGDTKSLHVRVDVDENDAWRLRPSAPAQAFLRGNRDLSTAMEFVRVEPYVVPKRSLTGESTERVDTRVLQVLYRFQREKLPVYVGQQMDVFIEAPPISSASAN
jgi:RND family efflux transporter MFP subunit